MATTKVKGKQVTYKAPGAGSVTRNLFDKLSELPTRADFATEQDYLNAVSSVDKLGAEAVEYLPSGTGVAATTVGDYLNNREVNVFNFMTDAEIADVKSGANAVDVGPKVVAASNYAASIGAELIFPDGDYCFKTNQTITSPVVQWRAVGKVRLSFEDVDLTCQPDLLGTTTVAVDSAVGNNSITLADASLIGQNTPIRIANNTIAESASSYRKQGVYYVIAKSGNTVFLDRPLRFAFGAAEAGNVVQILNPDSYIKWEGFEVFKKVANARIRATLFSFFAQVDLFRIRSICPITPFTNSYGVGISACAKIRIIDAYAKGGTYPFIVNTSSDIRVSNIIGRDCHHAIDFNTFSDNCVVDGFDIESINGGLNTHPAFRVWYMNGKTSDIGAVSNHRSLGGGWKNVQIVIGPNAFSNFIIQQAFLTDTTTITLAKQLGLAAVYEDISIIDQRAADNLFAPQAGYVTMRNITSNKTVGLGDQVIEAQTDNIVFNAPWRNRQTYRVFPKSNVIDATLNGSNREVNMRNPNLEIDNLVVRCRGDLFQNVAGEPYNFTLKVFDGWANNLNNRSMVGKLKIKAQLRHANSGSFDYIEKEFEFLHGIVGTSAIIFPLTATYTSGLSGVANESLNFTLSNPQQSGFTQSGDPLTWFWSIDVSMSSGRTSPFYSAQYELEMRVIN